MGEADIRWQQRLNNLHSAMQQLVYLSPNRK